MMGVTLYLPIKLLDEVIFDTTHTINLLVLTGIAGLCGMATYLLFTKLLKVEEIELFYKLVRKFNRQSFSASKSQLTTSPQLEVEE